MIRLSTNSLAALAAVVFAMTTFATLITVPSIEANAMNLATELA